MSLNDHYPISCPFCANASAFPPSPTSPIPRNPDRTKVDPNCYLLLSTEHVVAFLDILPIAPGHILLCPRKHYEKFSDLYAPPTPREQSWTELREAQDRQTTAQELGRWLPIVSRAVCRATGVEDWNLVQNNGARAAQVVPHVHFHFIPRFQEGRRDRLAAGQAKVDVGMLKSWKMFGKGAREDLDEEVGDEVAEAVRRALRMEIGEVEEGKEEAGEGGKAKL